MNRELSCWHRWWRECAPLCHAEATGPSNQVTILFLWGPPPLWRNAKKRGRLGSCQFHIGSLNEIIDSRVTFINSISHFRSKSNASRFTRRKLCRIALRASALASLILTCICVHITISHIHAPRMEPQD